MTKPITKINDLMTQAQLAKWFTKTTGKSTGSTVYHNLLKELKKTSTPLNLGTSVLYYPKEDIEKIFCFKQNNEVAINQLKEELKTYLEFHTNEKINKFAYPLSSNQHNLIKTQNSIFDKIIGYFQTKYHLTLQIKQNFLIFEKRA